MAESTWSFSQAFASQFQSSTSGLQSRIDAAKVAASSYVTDTLVEELSANLVKLTKSLADATGSLPSYDQRQYEEQLRTLEKSVSDLQSISKPKPRFTFRRKVGPPSSSPALQTSDTSKDIERTGADTTAVVSLDLHNPYTNLPLSSRSHEYLTFDSLPRPAPRDITIHDLDRCIVNLVPSGRQQRDGQDGTRTTSEISSVHVKKLSDTVLILPSIAGSVLMHGLTRCTIVVGCHQLRVHTSRNVDVYLSASSNPVIEHCSNMRFAGYPDTLLTQDKKSNQFSILDFSHIKSTPSPNWSLLNDDRLAHQWPLPDVTNQQELDVLLDRILPFDV